ncbi:MAG: hypothetical protein HIU91_09050 [Acidobacteria bacterium]|nr:hypothetical protein [Acidobacteriota bacterium]
MSKKSKLRSSHLLRMLEQKTTGPSANGDPASAPRAAEASPADDPTGSCRYADGLGQMQCESPVTKSDCDGKGGFFTPDARC